MSSALWPFGETPKSLSAGLYAGIAARAAVGDYDCLRLPEDLANAASLIEHQAAEVEKWINIAAAMGNHEARELATEGFAVADTAER